MNYEDAVKAAQGADTQDLLQHIAWTDVILPQLLKAKSMLTDKLVNATLYPNQAGEESREQIAGRLYGIDYIIKTFERILREGRSAKAAMADENIFFQ